MIEKTTPLERTGKLHIDETGNLHTNKAYLNALFEEGTRRELCEWLSKLDDENDVLRKEKASLLKEIEEHHELLSKF